MTKATGLIAMAALVGCATSAPVVQGRADSFPEHNVKWWVTGSVVPATRPSSIHVEFAGAPTLTKRLAKALAQAGYVVADEASAQHVLHIDGVYETNGEVRRVLLLNDVAWVDKKDIERERRITGDAVIATGTSAAAIDAGVMGALGGIHVIADSLLHSTGLADRFNNFVRGTGPSYKRGWSDQTLKLSATDGRNPQQQLIIMSAISSKSLWPDQLLDKALHELLRRYGASPSPAPHNVLANLSEVQDAMQATEVE